MLLFCLDSHRIINNPSSLTECNDACITSCAKYNVVYVGNNWDCGLRVYSLHFDTYVKASVENTVNPSPRSNAHLGVCKWRLRQSIVAHKGKITCIASDEYHLATGSDDCTVVVWALFSTTAHSHHAQNVHYFSFDCLLSTLNGSNDKKKAVHISDKHSAGLISHSRCVVRGHTSPLICVAVCSFNDIIVSCSQSKIFIHQLNGKFSHSLIIHPHIQYNHMHGFVHENEFDDESNDKNISDDEHENKSNELNNNLNTELSAIIAVQIAELGSSALGSSQIDLLSNKSDFDDNAKVNHTNGKKPAKNRNKNSIQKQCMIAIVRISAGGTIIFLSKTENSIFSCDINGNHWQMVQTDDNLMAMEVDASGKFLLTAGAIGIARVHDLLCLHRIIYQFNAVGDCITCLSMADSNRVFVGTDTGKIHLFCIPNYNQVVDCIDWQT